jgi:hypothetical protein
VDENVDVYLVRKHFSSGAWLVVEDVIKIENNRVLWICQVCQRDLHSQPSIIVCDSVLSRMSCCCQVGLESVLVCVHQLNLAVAIEMYKTL